MSNGGQVEDTVMPRVAVECHCSNCGQLVTGVVLAPKLGLGALETMDNVLDRQYHTKINHISMKNKNTTIYIYIHIYNIYIYTYTIYIYICIYIYILCKDCLHIDLN